MSDTEDKTKKPVKDTRQQEPTKEQRKIAEDAIKRFNKQAGHRESDKR